MNALLYLLAFKKISRKKNKQKKRQDLYKTLHYVHRLLIINIFNELKKLKTQEFKLQKELVWIKMSFCNCDLGWKLRI